MIFVNARSLQKPLTGVQRYTLNVLKYLNAETKLLYAPKYCTSGLLGYLWEQLILPLKLRKQDLLWSPANLGCLFHRNQILTIHDLAWLDHPEWFKKRFVFVYRFIIARAVKRSKLILTVSEYSKMRIIEAFSVPAEKIRVAHQGVDEHFSIQSNHRIKEVCEKYGLIKPYVLCVGSIESRKNLCRLFLAWQRLKQFHFQHHLVVVGEKGAAFSNITLGDTKEILFLGRVPDEELSALYSGALVFVYPSLYEGFGLPLLEAMACGVPILTSRVTAIPEVVGESAYLTNPYSVDAITDSLFQLLTLPELRQDLSQRGLKRIESFRWSQVIKNFEQVFLRN